MRNESTNLSFGLTRGPRSILFGARQRHSLGPVVRNLGSRALVCTDARLQANPQFAEMMQSLAKAGVETMVSADTQPELPLQGVLTCFEKARGFGADVVVGIGGGSCMDMAKLVSVLLAHGGDIADYYGEMKVPGPVAPVVAVPTTSGTGSEVTPVAVVADDRKDLKVGVSSPHLIPIAAICDPELTISCPPRLTAYSGADAMTHAIEAFTALRRNVVADTSQQRVFVGKNVLSDGYALSAIRLLSAWLPRAVAQGTDIEARSNVMLAALHAGLAFGTAGTAAAHAIQYPVGALTHTAHAAGVAVLMPYVMKFNRPSCEAEFAEISRALGVAGSDQVELADRAGPAVASLFASIGLPKTLADLEVTYDKVDWIARQTMLAARLVSNNPRELTEADAREIIKTAMTGAY